MSAPQECIRDGRGLSKRRFWCADDTSQAHQGRHDFPLRRGAHRVEGRQVSRLAQGWRRPALRSRRWDNPELA